MTDFVKGARVRLNGEGKRLEVRYKSYDSMVATVFEDGPNEHGFVRIAWDGTRLDVPRPRIDDMESRFLELAP
jgi:peptide methionine sulfoxide reductase MsrB